MPGLVISLCSFAEAATGPTKVISSSAIALSFSCYAIPRDRNVGTGADAVIEHITHLGLVVGKQCDHDILRAFRREPDDQPDRSTWDVRMPHPPHGVPSRLTTRRSVGVSTSGIDVKSCSTLSSAVMSSSINCEWRSPRSEERRVGKECRSR